MGRPFQDSISFRGLPFIVIAREVSGYTVEELKEKQKELKDIFPEYSILVIRYNQNKEKIKKSNLIMSVNPHPYAIHIR